MGASWSPRCAYTGSPNHDLGARDPRSPVSVDPCFNINSIPTNDANKISTGNAFCNYFTNIGQQCASTIGQATTSSSNYLKGNYQNALFLIPTTPR